MIFSDSENSLRLNCKGFRMCKLRQWRNWKDQQIIETIDKPGSPTEVWWDKTYESVVLFHHYDEQIVFCDPLDEVIRLKSGGEGFRYIGCEVIDLARFNQLKEAYGGENVHGPDFGKVRKELTLLDLIGSNHEARDGLRSAISLLLSN